MSYSNICIFVATYFLVFAVFVEKHISNQFNDGGFVTSRSISVKISTFLIKFKKECCILRQFFNSFKDFGSPYSYRLIFLIFLYCSSLFAIQNRIKARWQPLEGGIEKYKMTDMIQLILKFENKVLSK